MPSSSVNRFVAFLLVACSMRVVAADDQKPKLGVPQGGQIFVRLKSFAMKKSVTPFFRVWEIPQDGEAKRLVNSSSLGATRKADIPREAQYEFLVKNSSDVSYAAEILDDGYLSNERACSFRDDTEQTGAQLVQKLLGRVAETPEDSEKWTVMLVNPDEDQIELQFRGVYRDYRLVNVTIPPSSPHRNRNDIAKSPRLQVVFAENGKPIGEALAAQSYGWSSDFPASPENHWVVREGTDDQYGITLWDVATWSKAVIVTKTSLTNDDFRVGDIYEDQGELDSRSTAVKFVFKPVKP